MRAVNIVGYKDSGKTTLAVGLIAALKKRGLDPAAVKLSHETGLDKAGTDTCELLQEAKAVGAVAAQESAVFWRQAKQLHSLLPLLGADMVVVEGGKDLAVMPRIVVAKDAAQARRLGAGSGGLALAVYGPQGVDDVPAIQDLEALAELAAGRSFLLPGLDCQACGFASCRHLAALIVAGLAGPDQCQALASPVDIQVNGRPLALNPFAARIIGSAVRAMLAELKDYSPGQTVLTLRS